MEPQVTAPAPNAATSQYAIVEIMGHEKLAGRVTEVVFAGAPMLRVEVAATDKLPAFERLLSPAALFSVTPCTEPVALIVADGLQKTAVGGLYHYTGPQQLGLRAALGLPAPQPVCFDDEADDTDDEDDNRPF